MYWTKFGQNRSRHVGDISWRSIDRRKKKKEIVQMKIHSRRKRTRTDERYVIADCGCVTNRFIYKIKWVVCTKSSKCFLLEILSIYYRLYA